MQRYTKNNFDRHEDRRDKPLSHTASELSIRFNSMNQHFWAQNIKVYHKNNKKCHFAKSSGLHQFLDDTKIKISFKNWCLLAGNYGCGCKDDLVKWHFLFFYDIS